MRLAPFAFLYGAFMVAVFVVLPLPWAFVATLAVLVSFLWAVLLGMNDYLVRLEDVLVEDVDPDEFDLDYLADPTVDRWTERHMGYEKRNGDK